jgi:hypothetical protein
MSYKAPLLVLHLILDSSIVTHFIEPGPFWPSLAPFVCFHAKDFIPSTTVFRIIEPGPFIMAPLLWRRVQAALNSSSKSG